MTNGIVTALEIFGGWFALAIVMAVLWGVIAAGGWALYWQGVRKLWRRDPQPSMWGGLDPRG